MKILLTGATGFLGQRIVKHLLRKDYTVLALVRPESMVEVLPKDAKNLHILTINTQLSFEWVFDCHRDIDVIVHCATDYGRTSFFDSFVSNEHFPMRIIQTAIRKQRQTPIFINFDSFFTDFAEDYNYLGAYTLSKKHFKQWGSFLQKKHLLRFINLKLFHVYGEGDGDNKFANYIVRELLHKGCIELTDGKQVRDFIHVDDVVRALLSILENIHSLSFDDYDIGTGHPTSVRHFVELAHQLSSSGASLNFGAIPQRVGEINHAVAKLENVSSLGWAPKVTLEQGINRLIQYNLGES